MEAAFSDPSGPRLWRLAPYAAPLAFLFASIFLPIGGTATAATALTAIVLFHLIGLLPWRQRRSRRVELSFGPGRVTVAKAGTRSQDILAKDVVGATTARLAGKLVLTLQHRKRAQPITLELRNDAEAEKVRHALGIGHGGFGTVAWRTTADNIARIAFVGRLLAGLCALTGLGLTLGISEDAALMSSIFLIQIGVVGAVLGLVGLFARPADASVLMTSEGLRLKTPRGWFALPYDAVQHLEDHPRGFVFHVPQPYSTVAVERASPLFGAPSKEDRFVLVGQVLAATQRARGLGPHKNDVSGRLDVLRRRNEQPRDWLTRLDMAGQVLSTGPGYRGNTLEVEDLWAILEDPEAEPELRAGAARILRHVPTTRVRIEAALAAVRDEPTNQRLRIAVADDLDEASQELAKLDGEEALRKQMGVLPHPGRSVGR